MSYLRNDLESWIDYYGNSVIKFSIEDTGSGWRLWVLLDGRPFVEEVFDSRDDAEDYADGIRFTIGSK